MQIVKHLNRLYAMTTQTVISLSDSLLLLLLLQLLLLLFLLLSIKQIY